jgi:hypothetical protein
VERGVQAVVSEAIVFEVLWFLGGDVLSGEWFRRLEGGAFETSGTIRQWRTQDFFFGGGRFNIFSWGQRAERTEIWGR